MKRQGFLLICFLLISSVFLTLHAQEMTLQKMDSLLQKHTEELDGEQGAWTAFFEDRLLLVITDEASNRMRIFSPIMELEEVDPATLEKMLEANFHSALDAKYSIYNGIVISVYTHPLKELYSHQFVDALQQVATLAENYGSTYSSTDLIFGDGAAEEEEPKINVKPGGGKSN